MPRYFLHLSYTGTHFHGWQTQAPPLRTVQQTLESALAQVLGRHQHIHGCGRTDAGVHADGYVAHFDVPEPLNPSFAERLKTDLPPDIRLHRIERVADRAHAQRDATARTYRYRLGLTADTAEDPHVGSYHHHHLDLSSMQRVARAYAEAHDFAAFCRRPEKYPSTQCLVQACTLSRKPEGDELHFTITANRFLHNMVRLLVGRLVDVGRGALTLSQLEHALQSGNRLPYLRPAYAQGLSLTGVEYPERCKRILK